MTTHTIRRGETLSSIAKTYSVDMDALAKANGIANVNRISVNQSLTVPPLRNTHVPDAKLPKRSAKPEAAKTIESDISEALEEAWASGKRITTEWIEGLLQRLRTQEANESVQQEEKVPLTKRVKAASLQQEPAKKKGSRSKKTLNDVKEKLKEKLGKEPHVVTFKGVKLTNNEKKQIVAAVAVCEMNSDGFGSINADQEFVGRKFGKRGIENGISYPRIVHIGLSYGMIQYTQDSGSLGLLLQKMQAKNSTKFIEIFGGGDADIAQSLIDLTTTGRLDVVGNPAIPASGLTHWGKIRNTKEGQELKKLANSDSDKHNTSDLPVEREIRGKRVQPIPAAKGEVATDIWTGVWKPRFLAAGQVVDFQEVQLEMAVSDYMSPVLRRAQENKVRSALALAVITAGSIRNGPGSPAERLIYEVAKELGVRLPFDSSEDERKCIDAIANAKNGKVGNTKCNVLESHRAHLLIKDELDFLAEDLYDVSTYC